MRNIRLDRFNTRRSYFCHTFNTQLMYVTKNVDVEDGLTSTLDNFSKLIMVVLWSYLRFTSSCDYCISSPESSTSANSLIHPIPNRSHNELDTRYPVILQNTSSIIQIGDIRLFNIISSWSWSLKQFQRSEPFHAGSILCFLTPHIVMNMLTRQCCLCFVNLRLHIL